jgi:hypothetical protein
MKGVNKETRTTYQLGVEPTAEGKYQYRFLETNIDTLRVNVHDIILTILVNCSDNYSAIKSNYMFENNLTSPINNDGRIQNTVIELTTVSSKNVYGTFNYQDIVNNGYKKKLESYRSFVMNKRASLEDLKMDLWIIDIGLGGQFLKQICEVTEGVSYVIGSLLTQVSSEIIKTRAIARDWGAPEEAETDQSIIDGILDRLLPLMKDNRREYYDEMLKLCNKMRKEFEGITAEEIRIKLITEMCMVLSKTTKDFRDTFLTVSEACAKIPTSTNGTKPSMIIEKGKGGIRDISGLIATVGGRVWNTPIREISDSQPMVVLQKELDEGYEIKFETNKNSKFNNEDKRQAQTILSVLKAYSGLSGKKEQQLQEL